MKVLVEISAGELFDKITILKIKTEKIKDKGKLENIHKELDILQKEALKFDDTSDSLSNHINNLKNINSELWDIENIKREMEASKDFGENFIKISRDVHFKNDVRAKIKKDINNLTNSNVSEEKEYSKY
jgi:predicted  nucleic acid-binding Zn-ribbon protein